MSTGAGWQRLDGQQAKLCKNGILRTILFRPRGCRRRPGRLLITLLDFDLWVVETPCSSLSSGLMALFALATAQSSPGFDQRYLLFLVQHVANPIQTDGTHF